MDDYETAVIYSRVNRLTSCFLFSGRYKQIFQIC